MFEVILKLKSPNFVCLNYKKKKDVYNFDFLRLFLAEFDNFLMKQNLEILTVPVPLKTTLE